jgi:DNA-binding transcriptional ArsR family regulator
MSSAFVPDVAALRALAHPARLDLLDLLRVHDTLTAAECARLLGTSTKSCSYHLGILARQGLVVRAEEPSEDGRERPWRHAADEFLAPPQPGAGAGQLARTAAMRVLAERDQELFAAYLDREPGDAADWREAVTVHTRTAVMTADQLREWGLAVEAVTRDHVSRAGRVRPADARAVRLTIRGFPQRLAVGGPGRD